MESAAMGIIAGVNAYRQAMGMSPVVPPATTAIGALINYITHSEHVPFQPMNVNFGLFPPLPGKRRQRRQHLSTRALEDLKRWKETMGSSSMLLKIEGGKQVGAVWFE